MTLTMPSGTPASRASRAKYRADRLESSLGLMTIALPVASAGATFQPSMAIGKFHGSTAHTTPSGTFCTQPQPEVSRR